MPATLFVVATPIGNLEDITARALRVLREVTLIAAEDTRRTANLLARYAIATPTTSLHEHNEVRKSRLLIDRLKRGESVALVSDAGTPTLSDPGERLVRAAIDAGIRVEPVPGPSALLAALAVSGLPSASFTFLGFPPIRSKDRKHWFDRLAAAEGTVVFFEAPHRIVETLRSILRVIGDVPILVARELTKVHEELVRGPISVALERLSSPKGEFTVVLYIGRITEKTPACRPGGAALLEEFGYLIESMGLKRRAAIAELARRYQRPAREIYRAIESAKESRAD